MSPADVTIDLINGITVLQYAADGALLASERDAVELVNEAFNAHAQLVAVPVERFDDMFFHLSTRIAGEFIQKVVTYRVQLAILGDISEHVNTSTALRDFVYESNRGDHVWFLADESALRERLS
ncbi:MAG: hypothetical protein JWR36_293 [Glaciihabitans sp.]|jgi:hypothetical protein|nr:hypothetical protein [Glaciihabitans sp.]MDQ1570700.1 hypothetical protein [Actinomycetota bacterium]